MSETGTLSNEKVMPEVKAALIPVYIMGKRYDVPDSLTIMKAMEYAGYQYIRGAGCRGGVCGACATVYRQPGDYHIRVGLACQTVVLPNMYLTQLPFYPANRAVFDWESCNGASEEVWKAYPEVFRCLACNACTKVCPMDIQVMDYIAEIKRGDLEKATETSFDCIQCGLCATRCMAEMPQYHIAQMVRRLQGRFHAVPSEHCDKQVAAIKSGLYDNEVDSAMALGTVDPFDPTTETDDIAKLKLLYNAREMEPHTGEESWKPESNVALLK
ncbi:4Fe-4S dicluster domain-containing protein [bacterium]|nr:4Fe-4S dicluster domain-containing protein [bacterium]